MLKFNLNSNKMSRMIAASLCVILTLGMFFQVTSFSAPEGETTEAEQAVTSVADASTMNSWQEFFGNETDTSNVGKIWTDKTVSDEDITLESIEGGNGITVERKENDNFLVGLSALSSTKSVTLEAAIPVDVMFVLDISGSMKDEDAQNIRCLIMAINETIPKILNMNEKNRVGVVLYSGAKRGSQASGTDTASCPLPLDRYTTTSTKGEYLVVCPSETGRDFEVKVDTSVKDSTGKLVISPGSEEEKNNSYEVDGFTYIQNGLMEAMECLNPESEGNSEGRIPVIALMSDGAPTAASVHYTERGESTVGYGQENDIRMTFLTQLTAAWMKRELEGRYQKTPLFYTVGLLSRLTEDEDRYARMVLDPSEENSESDLDNWWDTFLDAAPGQEVSLEAVESGKTITVTRQDDGLEKTESGECTDRYYVDEYFAANNAENLSEKFSELVERVKIQSAAPPTEDDEDNQNYSGYLTFEDEIGEYMSVADMKGVMYGGELHTGSTFSEKMKKGGTANSAEIAEFLDSLVERLKITVEEAETLLENAQNTGQVSYESEDVFSNYIGWYAKADGTYLAPYSEYGTKPEDAVFVSRSYFYYGKAAGTIDGEKLMYLGVRVSQNLITGTESVRFSIPASLIPLVEYHVKRNAANAEDGYAEKTMAYPARLFYEVGLREEISEYDLSTVDSDYTYLNQNDISKIGTFYSNAWEAKEESVEAKTTVQYTPSKENECYYYTENTPIYVKENDENYVLYQGEKPDANDTTEYYSQKMVYNSTGATQNYCAIDKASLDGAAETEGDNGWSISSGTFHYETLKEKGKGEGNATGTTAYVSKPMLQTNLETYEPSSGDNNTGNYVIEEFLGNNGKIVIKQGKIQIAKYVSDSSEKKDEKNVEPEFQFEMNFNPTEGEKIPVAIDGKKGEETISSEIQAGIVKFSLKDQESVEFWLPAGKSVSVAEVGELVNRYKTTMQVTQNGQEEAPLETQKVEFVEIKTKYLASVKVTNTAIVSNELIEFYKINASDEPLGGAVFELYRLECENPDEHNEEVHNQIIKDNGTEDILCWKWIGEAVSDEKDGYLQFLDSEGEKIEFTKATYRLLEKEAPDGYLKVLGQWNMIVVPGGSVRVQFQEILGEHGERPPAIDSGEKKYYFLNYKPIDPPITGGRGVKGFAAAGTFTTLGGIMFTVHLILQKKRGKL